MLKRVLELYEGLHSVDAGLFHNAEEFVFTDLAVSIFVKLVDHGLELVVTQVLAEFTRNSTQIAERDFASAVFVEQLEGF